MLALILSLSLISLYIIYSRFNRFNSMIYTIPKCNVLYINPLINNFLSKISFKYNGKTYKILYLDIKSKTSRCDDLKVLKNNKNGKFRFRCLLFNKILLIAIFSVYVTLVSYFIFTLMRYLL